MSGRFGARKVFGLLLALFALAVLAGTAGLLVVLWMGEKEPRLASQAFSLQVAGIGGLGLTLLLVSLFLGWQFWSGAAPAPFRTRRFWVLMLLLPLLLVLGTFLALWEKAPAFLLPAVHVLTLLALPALVLGILGALLGEWAGSWQDVLGGLLGGASLGAGAAVLLEGGIALLLGVLLVLLGQVPLEWMTGSLPAFQTPEEAMALLEDISPLVVLAGLVFLAFLAPLVEEGTKTLAVGLAGLWLRPSPARAFLLGAASGAGFALAENFLNSGFFGFVWGGGILVRLAATVIHTATGALMGWGWGEWWTGRKYLRLPLAFVGAFGIHALWNGAAGTLVGVLYLIIRSGLEEAEPTLTLVVSNLVGVVLILLALAFQALLFLGVTAGLLIVARSLRPLSTSKLTTTSAVLPPSAPGSVPPSVPGTESLPASSGSSG